MNEKIAAVAALLVAVFLGGCATQQADGTMSDRNNKAIGAAVGAVAGAVLGGQLDDDGNRDRGVIIGAVAGAAAGAGIGHVMDRQEDEFRAELDAEQRRSEIEIQRVRDDLLKLTFDNEVTFDFDSAAVKPSFKASLRKVADVMTKYQSQGEIVGHTDSTGAEGYNQQLSERRALSVRDFLIASGVRGADISASGRGEYEPRESNATEAGRALNRRVEILVTPGNSADTGGY